MSHKEVYDYLKLIGCCDICVLRYLNGRGEDYDDVQKSFKKRGVLNDHLENIELDNSTNGGCGGDGDHDDHMDANDKRKKLNVCIACLDLFSTKMELLILEHIEQNPELKTYNCDTLLTSISLPIALHLRQLTIWIDLMEKFPGKFNGKTAPDIPIKEIFKIIKNPLICKLTDRQFEQNQNGIMINLYFNYKWDQMELDQLKLVNPKLFEDRQKQRRKYRKEFLTRNAFERNFIPDEINRNTFIKYITLPASVPTDPIELDHIKITGPTVFVGGRYCKLIRTLSQTPWILNGKRFIESSVQELINVHIATHFNVAQDTTTFAASGREDVDVRCLGRGRPFYVEIPDSHETQLSGNKAEIIEQEINKSNSIIVRNLQMVKREDLIRIKQGEENKKKQYRAFCVLNENATVEIMKKLTIPDGFQIQQLTPLRVLHRRPFLKRSRTVHSVKGYLDKNNHKIVILDIVTSAGTYIKELVHGEFGRTKPSIQSIIGQWIDIVLLDVIDIDLDWP